jgi:hypothetical protein
MKPKTKNLGAQSRAAQSVAFAIRSGLVDGPEKNGVDKRQISARLSRPLIQAAKNATGIDNTTDLLSAALAHLVAPNFGQWLLANAGRLPKDFELDV